MWQVLQQRLVGLGRVLDFTAGFDAVAGRQRPCGELRRAGCRDSRAKRALDHAIATPCVRKHANHMCATCCADVFDGRVTETAAPTAGDLRMRDCRRTRVHGNTSGAGARQRLAVLLAGGALAGVAASPAATAVTYTGKVTGVMAHDMAGGTGGYSPGYLIQPVGSRLNYVFADGDRIATSTAAVADIQAVSLVSANGASPVTLDVAGESRLGISATRAAVGAWGVAVGVDVNGGSLVVDGGANVYAQADDPVPTSAALGVQVRSGTLAFQGPTEIKTYTPGYSQALWVYQGTVDFNGTANILAQARGSTTCGVYNSGGGASRINFHHGATIAAHGIWPSDNVHGIYNDNVNTQFYVTGALDLDAVSYGSTAFGVRNQGYLDVSGNARFAVNGPRSTHGIANTHRTARMNFGGDVDITVTNGTGYVPFGNPTAIGNTYSGTSYIRFGGNVTARVTATTETYAIDNMSTLQATVPSRRMTLSATTNCADCNAYAIRNTGGTVQIAGGLIAGATAPGAGKRHAIWNVGAGDRNGTVSVNETGAQLVQLDGDVTTGALPGQTGVASTRIVLATAGSHLRGRVIGYTGADNYYQAGKTELGVGANTHWSYQGAGNRADFGDGTLAVAGLGMLDASGVLTDVLAIDSSDAQGADVTLADQAIVRLHTDIGAAAAGRVNFGSGIQAFSATGTLQIAIDRDPLLDSGTIADVDAPVVYAIATPAVVVDATPAAAGAATFAAAAGRAETQSVTIAGVARSAIVRPIVAVSGNRRQILLNGLSIRVLPRDTIFRGTIEH